MPPPAVHLLTCPARAAAAAATLRSWEAIGWGAMPRIFCDDAAEAPGQEWGTPARAGRVSEAYARWLRTLLGERGAPDDWLLLLEDDLEFHPRFAALVASWEVLDDPRCGMASLFNASMQPTARWGEMPRAFAAEPSFFVGTQALLLRRWAAALALAQWHAVPGLRSQRLTAALGREGPIWIHRPSLVQHVAADSSWGARVTQALDYDPAWPE